MPDSDPLGAFQQRVMDFILYLDTAFSASPSEINEERRELLLNGIEHFQIPFLEPLPRYRSSGVGVDAALGARLTSATPPQRTLFVEAMQRGLLNGLFRGGL